MTKTIVALYKDFDTARDVVEDLVEAGFARDHVSMVANDASGRYGQTLGKDRDVRASDDVKAGEGAGFGAVVGGLLGLGAMLIPGVGPVIAAGPLVAGLVGAGVGAAAGAATGGIVASLVDMGVSEEDAGYYAEGIRRGGTLVTVQADNQWEQQVVNIMSRHSPVDIRRSAESWRQSGWKGFDTSETTAQMDADQEARFEVIEEELQVGKREVDRGGVRAQTIITEEPVNEQVTLREEHVTVDRRPVDRRATEADFDARERTIEVTEHGEEPVVSKQARVVEEVVIRKDVDQHTETVSDVVRHQDVEIEQLSPERRRELETYDRDFRTHYNQYYGTTNRDYNYYMPAYRRGYLMATDPQYSNYRTWSEAEPHLRRDWESRDQGPWEDFKDAIQHGWNRIRGRS